MGPPSVSPCSRRSSEACCGRSWANVPTYTRWMLDADPGPAYEYHHLVLQLLQSAAPGRWALKTPHHAAFLDEGLRQYPDARLVMTHRDPITVVAPLCS